jgi:hypothetical protein
MDTGAHEPPRQKDPETGLEETMRPMLVVFHSVERVPGPGGSELEVVTFQAWTPSDWSKPENWGLSDKGSHMAGTNYKGESVPVLIPGTPIMVKAPRPQLATARSLPPDKRPRA